MTNPVQEANETLKAINDALLRQEGHARRLRGEFGAPPSPNSANGSEDEVIRQLQCALVAEGEALAETIVQVWAGPFKFPLLLVPPTEIGLLSGESISWVRHLVTAMQDSSLTAIELIPAVVSPCSLSNLCSGHHSQLCFRRELVKSCLCNVICCIAGVQYHSGRHQ